MELVVRVQHAGLHLEVVRMAEGAMSETAEDQGMTEAITAMATAAEEMAMVEMGLLKTAEVDQAKIQAGATAEDSAVARGIEEEVAMAPQALDRGLAPAREAEMTIGLAMTITIIVEIIIIVERVEIITRATLVDLRALWEVGDT